MLLSVALKVSDKSLPGDKLRNELGKISARQDALARRTGKGGLPSKYCRAQECD
jgi:hypothetical protein